MILIFSVHNGIAKVQNLNFKSVDTISVCSYSEFTPISYGNGKGYEADLMRAIAKDFKVHIKFYPQKEYDGLWLLPSQKNSPCDVAIGGLTPSDYRQKEGAIFSIGDMAPYSQSLLVRKADYDSGKIRSYASFKNTQLKIGIVPGTAGERYGHILAERNGVPLSVFISLPSEAELLPALKAKKIDAIARGEIGNDYQVSLDSNLVTIVTGNFGEAFTIAVNNQNPQLLIALNQAIKKITDKNKIGYAAWQKNHQVFMK